MKALALAIAVALGADGGVPADAPTLPPLNVVSADVDGQTLVCMDPQAAITWTRGCRAGEFERDACLKREDDANGFRFKWAALGAGIGVSVTLIVVGAILGAQKLQK